MSLVDIFRLVGDIISDFVSSKVSGIIFLAIIAIPLALQAFRGVLNLYVRCIHEDKKKTKDNDR